MPEGLSTQDLILQFEHLLDGRDKALNERIEALDKANLDTVQAMSKVSAKVGAMALKPHSKAWGDGGTPVETTLSSALMETKAWSERPQELKRSSNLEFTINLKDISGIGLARPVVVPGVMGGPRQFLRLRRFVPSSPVAGGAVTYTREASFTNMAAAVAETGVKPKSDKTFQTLTEPVEVIAHYIKVSKQTYQDVSGLPAELDSNLRYGLELKLEQQLLKGTGATPQIGPGLYLSATAMTAPTGTPTLIDVLYMAVAQLSAAGWFANGIVVSAADYSAMQLLKDTTGRYLLSSVPDLPPMVVSPYLAAGEWLVGDFSQTMLYMREEGNVQVAYQSEDDFIRNMICILAELRCALAIYQPAALLRNPGAVGREAEEPPQRPATVKR